MKTCHKMVQHEEAAPSTSCTCGQCLQGQQQKGHHPCPEKQTATPSTFTDTEKTTQVSIFTKHY